MTTASAPRAAGRQSGNTSGVGTSSAATKILFDGPSLAAWRGYKSEAVPAGWRIDHGVLTKDGQVADIVSRDEFGDFELEIEWKIGEGGNSGIFIAVPKSTTIFTGAHPNISCWTMRKQPITRRG